MRTKNDKNDGDLDLSKFKRVESKRVDPNAAKIPVSLRLDAIDLLAIRDEADRLGIPYQTLIGSIVHRFVSGQLIDKKDIELKKIG
jgi:predicted DNA binding CopG/RHH family protein